MKCKMSWKLVLLCILKIDVSWLTLQIEVLHHGSWSVLQYSLLDQARGHQYWQLDLQTALSFLHCHSLRQFSHWGGQTVLWRPNQLSGNEIPKNPPKNPIYSFLFLSTSIIFGLLCRSHCLKITQNVAFEFFLPIFVLLQLNYLAFSINYCTNLPVW